MKARERPILFSAPMVRALLAGVKSQTRRIVAPQPRFYATSHGTGCWYPDAFHKRALAYGNEAHLRRGLPLDFAPHKVGDLLWVRETWASAGNMDGDPTNAAGDIVPWGPEVAVLYAADPGAVRPEVGRPGWRPSIFMPRWASRLLLRVTRVRVERLGDLTEADAEAEGVRSWTKDGVLYKFGVLEPGEPGCWPWADMPRSRVAAFARAWDLLHDVAHREPDAPDVSFAASPWVWVYDLQRVTVGQAMDVGAALANDDTRHKGGEGT